MFTGTRCSKKESLKVSEMTNAMTYKTNTIVVNLQYLTLNIFCECDHVFRLIDEKAEKSFSIIRASSLCNLTCRTQSVVESDKVLLESSHTAFMTSNNLKRLLKLYSLIPRVSLHSVRDSRTELIINIIVMLFFYSQRNDL